jgi:hypothetical protein
MDTHVNRDALIITRSLKVVKKYKAFGFPVAEYSTFGNSSKTAGKVVDIQYFILSKIQRSLKIAMSN